MKIIIIAEQHGRDGGLDPWIFSAKNMEIALSIVSDQVTIDSELELVDEEADYKEWRLEAHYSRYIGTGETETEPVTIILMETELVLE